MRRNLTLIIELTLLIFIVMVGVIIEMKRDIYNGTAAHLIIGPFAPLIVGTLLIMFRKSFWKTFLLSWLITSLIYYALLELFIWHYDFSWQPEWIVFWSIQSLILFIIHLITKRAGPKTARL